MIDVNGRLSPALYFATVLKLVELKVVAQAMDQSCDRLDSRRRKLFLVMRLTLRMLRRGWTCLLYTSPSPRDGLLS
eukprot:6211857-Pleurochrysis_carterae.AAC.3